MLTSHFGEITTTEPHAHKLAFAFALFSLNLLFLVLSIASFLLSGARSHSTSQTKNEGEKKKSIEDGLDSPKLVGEEEEGEKKKKMHKMKSLELVGEEEGERKKRKKENTSDEGREREKVRIIL